MIDLFFEGGPVYMGILTIILTVLVAVFLYAISKKSDFSFFIKQIGLLGLVVGVLGQLQGLYQMLDAVQSLESVSPAMLAGGLKVSLISTFYGFIIFLTGIIFKIIHKRQVGA